MSGNSKQRRQRRKDVEKRLEKFEKVLLAAIRPWVKEEHLAEFDECCRFINEIKTDARKPQPKSSLRDAPSLEGF